MELYREVLEERWRCFDAEAFVEADPLRVVYDLMSEVKGERGEVNCDSGEVRCDREKVKGDEGDREEVKGDEGNKEKVKGDTGEVSGDEVVEGKYVEHLAKITAPAKLGSVSGKSACKRLCMFLRWMVRTDKPDLGLWRKIKSSELFAVLDVHVVRQARENGLICGSSTASWKSVRELTECYRSWCADDPLKYDMVMMGEDLE